MNCKRLVWHNDNSSKLINIRFDELSRPTVKANCQFCIDEDDSIQRTKMPPMTLNFEFNNGLERKYSKDNFSQIIRPSQFTSLQRVLFLALAMLMFHNHDKFASPAEPPVVLNGLHGKSRTFSCPLTLLYGASADCWTYYTYQTLVHAFWYPFPRRLVWNSAWRKDLSWQAPRDEETFVRLIQFSDSSFWCIALVVALCCLMLVINDTIQWFKMISGGRFKNTPDRVFGNQEWSKKSGWCHLDTHVKHRSTRSQPLLAFQMFSNLF